MRRGVIVSVAAGALLLGCSTGYMKASDLKEKGRGPEDCQTSCHDLGMEMAALVLVSNNLPACVCTPRGGADPAHASAGAVGGYVVVAAAAAAQQQQQLQQQQPQQPATIIH
jgi:hypothetical protein